jgi:hypothetical protein
MKRLMHCSKTAALNGSILVAPNLQHHLSGMAIIEELASDDVLDSAYEWLCRRRRDYSANSDVWALRRCWPREKERIKGELLSGNYRFSLLSRITLKNGEETDLWSARDALVLKALAIGLGKHLPVSSRCTHIKGNGGAKYAVREVRDHLPDILILAPTRWQLRGAVKVVNQMLGTLKLEKHPDTRRSSEGSSAASTSSAIISVPWG